MRIIIDAHIVNGYFQESTKGSQSFLTHSTEPLFNRVGKDDFVYLDNGGMIKNEWRSSVDTEWFDAWYPGLLIEGAAFEIEVDNCKNLKNVLRSLGFPATGRDFWYIRTAKAVIDLFQEAIIVTEDIDFYDARKKNCTSKERERILRSGNGLIAKTLMKRENIIIRCLANYP